MSVNFIAIGVVRRGIQTGRDRAVIDHNDVPHVIHLGIQSFSDLFNGRTNAFSRRHFLDVVDDLDTQRNDVARQPDGVGLLVAILQDASADPRDAVRTEQTLFWIKRLNGFEHANGTFLYAIFKLHTGEVVLMRYGIHQAHIAADQNLRVNLFFLG